MRLSSLIRVPVCVMMCHGFRLREINPPFEITRHHLSWKINNPLVYARLGVYLSN
jgi:hypothetical protein